MAAMVTTVLRGGTLFDGHRYAGPGALVLRDDRIALVLTGPELEALPRDFFDVSIAKLASRTTVAESAAAVASFAEEWRGGTR